MKIMIRSRRGRFVEIQTHWVSGIVVDKNAFGATVALDKEGFCPSFELARMPIGQKIKAIKSGRKYRTFAQTKWRTGTVVARYGVSSVLVEYRGCVLVRPGWHGN